ncbi:MAG: 30S ribosomal protein S18 [Actinobacteria bacterium]|jgi:small subunit ribosomal protein S18|nr:30S ribosomal protein S18 [Actinomycetota bacterium]NCV97104.1 30S ribosomal protein S18 [Acidimicrobiia bacterium]NBS36242.1 30S ribosomal protein S18 [Actinomycetota bacterium]NCV09635.1 30S ribosomal protein S18 [Actinomycetota bacterium]NCV47242.1 30S ribosomal protein S18 [Actinomycetota bacterium]
MTSKKNKLRAAKLLQRRYKKKPNPLNPERIVYIDYKDVNLLQRFMSDRSKLRARRMTGADVQQQRDIATAVKNAREMALLPYTKRVAGLRAPRGRGGEDREERGGVSRDVVERYENLAAAEAVSETPDAAAGADTPTEG